MTRKDLENINKDREIIELRMQSEDLINNAESFTNEEFKREAQRIEDEINARIALLYRNGMGE